jgi:CHASE2 domain
MNVTVKVVISIVGGLLISIGSWFYLNSALTMDNEDGLLQKEVMIRNNILKIKPTRNRELVIVNTGNDHRLIDDSLGLGSVVVADREKLYQFLRRLSRLTKQPRLILMDIQFHYPYVDSRDSARDAGGKTCVVPGLPAPALDDSLQCVIKGMSQLFLGVGYQNGRPLYPKYSGNYAISHFDTYGEQVNKIQLLYPSSTVHSIPCLLNEKLDGASYMEHGTWTTCNGSLCFNYLLPDYYYSAQSPGQAPLLPYFNLGETFTQMSYPRDFTAAFGGKILLIGDFTRTNRTPAGEMPGIVVTANAYLSLYNGKQFVTWPWCLFQVLVFSLLTYTALFAALPAIKVKTRFAFSEILSHSLNQSISYVGLLALLSFISVFLFSINISLFLPAFVFSAVAGIKKIYHAKKNT